MSRAFGTIDAVAAALPIDNIDTDKILPGRYLKTVSRAGLGKALFAEMRYDAEGGERHEFVLNREPWREAGILVAGENFGCGSSREHAPWALVDFGITCLIARSFADIFYNNCFKNGILPIRLDGESHSEILRSALDPAMARLRVDLERQIVEVPEGSSFFFELDPGRKSALIDGRDEVAETLLLLDRITSWESGRLHPPSDVRVAL